MKLNSYAPIWLRRLLAQSKPKPASPQSKHSRMSQSATTGKNKDGLA